MMNRNRYALTTLLITLLLAGCVTCPTRPGTNSDLDALADYMTGFFSSLAQSVEDPQYYDIHLHMARIWPGQKDGYWLYIEQAMAGEDPYRQRIYHVTEAAPGIYVSKVYEIANPDTYIGAWAEPVRFKKMKPSDLIDRTGCSIYMVREPDGSFRGMTNERDCLSELRGAAFATSQVRITATTLMSWDRGYDAEGKQVWGAYKGGYVFDKMENFALK